MNQNNNTNVPSARFFQLLITGTPLGGCSTLGVVVTGAAAFFPPKNPVEAGFWVGFEAAACLFASAAAFRCASGGPSGRRPLSPG